MVQACAGFTDITPPFPVPLAGFSGRTGNYSTVNDPLEANVLVIKSDASRVIILSVDLLYASRALRSGILNRLEGLVKDEELFLAATHTHFAPSVDDTKPAMGTASSGYVDFAAGRIADLIGGLLQDNCYEQARLIYKTQSCDHCVNRRRLCRTKALSPASKKRARMQPDFKSPRDKQIRAVSITGSGGNILAFLWNYSCHPVCFPFADRVSADYPGRVRAYLRQRHGAALPVIFLQGFSGNLRPPAFKRPPTGSGILRYLAGRVLNGPRFGPFTLEEWDGWSNGLCRSAASLLPCSTNIEVTCGEVRSARVSIPLEKLGLEGSAPLTIHAVNLGENIKMIGMSAELVYEYAAILEKLFQGVRVIPVGCIDHVFGYLPTSSMLPEGGYEADGFLPWFGLSGLFTKNFQEIVLGELAGL